MGRFRILEELCRPALIAARQRHVRRLLDAATQGAVATPVRGHAGPFNRTSHCNA